MPAPALVVLALLLGPGLAAAQGLLTLELLSPREDPASTPREVVHVLGRTAPGAQVRVGGEPVTVHATGVFARDRVPLAPGVNHITIEARSADGQTLVRTLEIERTPPPPAVQWPTDRLFLDGASLRPDQALRVAPGEAVEVAVRATPGQQVEARLPGQGWQPLAETGPASGRYRARLGFTGGDDIEAAPVQVRIRGVALPRSAGPRAITALTPGAAGQWRADPERLFSVGPEGAELLHGLHEVRLGGPYLAELPPGALLHATGQRGEMLRVRLSPDTTAWVAERSLAPATPATPPPHAAPTTMSVAGGADGDVVNIPLLARVPYAVRAVADAAGRHALEVEIFDSHHAVTWITHRAGARVVRELTAEQAGPGRVRVRIALHEPRLWGWRVERTANALRIVVRAAPALAAQGSPLAGLRVALEPGHGSGDNLGAVGATAVPEKDVNRWAVEALKAELEGVGAFVTVVRENDDNPALRERARRVVESQAQLFVSVHANATDTSQGFLRTAGASTYYKHATARDLAAAVQRRLLEQTGLDDFGLVGNFNYTPIRLVTWMPAILVEQAFLSHPGDEARLLDPAFRALMARAVRQGLEDFLRSP
ncbi:MAG: N-acetylmuramoyl-L-alanine amidase [Rubrivivax sp.]|nr:N-acetylmuramoyl-L-alanine amidase [Rubrivivax sp.]